METLNNTAKTGLSTFNKEVGFFQPDIRVSFQDVNAEGAVLAASIACQCRYAEQPDGSIDIQLYGPERAKQQFIEKLIKYAGVKNLVGYFWGSDGSLITHRFAINGEVTSDLFNVYIEKHGLSAAIKKAMRLSEMAV